MAVTTTQQKNIFVRTIVLKVYHNGYHHWEMELATLVQILDTAVCVSLHANSLGKSMNLSVAHPAMDK